MFGNTLNPNHLDPPKKQPQRHTDDRMNNLPQKPRAFAQVDHLPQPKCFHVVQHPQVLILIGQVWVRKDPRAY
jgi:hypothetical protein